MNKYKALFIILCLLLTCSAQAKEHKIKKKSKDVATQKEELDKIVDLMLTDTEKALENKDITINLTQDAKDFILEKGTNLKFGARPLRRAIQRYIEDEISEKILKGEIKDGDKVKITKENDTLHFDVE